MCHMHTNAGQVCIFAVLSDQLATCCARLMIAQTLHLLVHVTISYAHDSTGFIRERGW